MGQISVAFPEGLKVSDYKNEIGSLLVDSRGYLWMANGSEVVKARYNGETLVPEKRYPVFYTMSLTESKGGIVWATSASNRVFAFMPDGEMKPNTLYPATFVFVPVALPLRSGGLLTAAFL